MSDWPPHYSIRHHHRAKYARLRIDPRRGLEVVLPQDVPERLAHDLVFKSKDWIRRHQHLLSSAQAFELPERIDLNGDDGPVRIDYPDQADRLWRESANTLQVAADQAPEALRDWLKTRARERLPGRLHALAGAHDFHYQRCRIGLQRSRWGSCSSRGTISLNAALLLIEPALCDHVMLHELTHTRHMHHGPAFYAEMARLNPDHRAHDTALKAAWARLPGWLFASK